MSSLDEESLAIYDYLYEYYEYVSETYDQYGNIIGLCFHDLIAHFSGILFFREKVSAPSYKILFPYVNEIYSAAPFQVSRSDYISYLPRDGGLRQSLRERQILPVAIGSGISWGHKQRRYFRRLLSLLTAQQKFTECFLVSRSKQIDILTDCIQGLCQQYSIPNSAVVENNWRDFVTYHTTEVQHCERAKGAIVGSRVNLENRKVAINFLQQGKKVIAYTHGEISNEIMDEPAVGYGELGLCSTLVEYGKYRHRGKYNRPLVPPETTACRTSEVVRNIYRRTDTIGVTSRSEAKWLYVPTGYGDHSRYGPFRGPGDNFYKKWQEDLVRCFPNVTTKVHPKDQSYDGGKIETRLLEECITEYDVLIYDYYSTAMTIGIFTDKPIIYFDIGSRNMSEEFRRDLKKRIFFCEIDLSGENTEQITDFKIAFEQVGIEWSNKHLAKYSIADGKNYGFWAPLLEVI